MKLTLSFLVLLAFLLAACATPALAPTTTPGSIDIRDVGTITPTPPFGTETSTKTPTPEATATPTETPTPEVTQFPICQIEQFRDCPIPLEDIYNGNVDKWLDTLKKPFDPAKINDVPLVWYHGWESIRYKVKDGGNFKVLGPPQYRDITAGYMVYEKDGVKYEYIFLPILFWDSKTNESHWVKTVSPLYARDGYSGKFIEKFNIDTWRNKMKITTIFTSNSMHLPNPNIIDPLVAMTFEKYPDMADRFQKFVDGDMSVLSEKDMIFLTLIGTSSGHWLE